MRRKSMDERASRGSMDDDPRQNNFKHEATSLSAAYTPQKSQTSGASVSPPPRFAYGIN